MNHIELGRYGEDLATHYLKSQGYDVLERNIRYRFGEVDIIAKTENILIVVEVKTRRTKTYGMPCEAVHWKKKQHIRHVISMFLATRDIEYESIRFDVIEVYIPQVGDHELRHMKACHL
ncbi:YraN family protein [Veillonella sp. VA139]|uniref:YraN family protein n=1 Tax=Veillonella sp. VA139 TaxID=741830 RepID=UPI000F8D8068|nr:YraN family protein [Veillonella sp. VA139]